MTVTNEYLYLAQLPPLLKTIPDFFFLSIYLLQTSVSFVPRREESEP